MILGLLIAFLITFVITVSVGIVLILAYHETQGHMYSSYTVALPQRRFRSYLEREEDQQRLAAKGKDGKTKHLHYQK